MLQIRCSNDVETEVPGIILVIPPPDKKAFNEAQRYVTKARLPLFGQYMRFLYSYFMPICSIVKTIALRCRELPDALLHKAECNSASGRQQHQGVIVCLYYKQA